MSVLRTWLLAAGVGSAAVLGDVGFVRAAPLAGLSLAAPPLQVIRELGVENLAPEPAHYRSYSHRHHRRYYHHRYYRRYHYYRPYRYVYRPYRYYAPRYYYPQSYYRYYYRPHYYYRPYFYRWW